MIDYHKLFSRLKKSGPLNCRSGQPAKAEPSNAASERRAAIHRWLEAPQKPLQETTNAKLHRLIEAARYEQKIAFYYFGGECPRQLRRANILAVFRTEGCQYTYVKAYCHWRKQARIFRTDKIDLA